MIRHLKLARTKYGDLDCFMDLSPDGSDCELDPIETVVVGIDDDSKPVQLFITSYAVKHKLVAVK